MKYTFRSYFLLFAIIFLLVACSKPGGDYPGTEYMPDMSHSTAYEANIYDYYSYNTWGTEEEYKKMAMPRKPVAGTVARGYVGVSHAGSVGGQQAVLRDMTAGAGISVPVNGAVPYYYGDTEEERTRATAEIFNNPFPITTTGLATGKELFEVYCGICHGKKGDGNGYLVRDDGGVYPAAPTSFLTDELINSNNGRYYHSIMYGKNVMGSYSDKLSYEERWQVIHYIRSLQAGEKKLVYSEEGNTLNQSSVAGITVKDQLAPPQEANHTESADEDHDGHDHDGHDHDGHDHGDHDGDHGHDHEH